MARQSAQPRILLDWIAVSYRSVGFASAILVAVLLGGVVWWYFFAPFGPGAEAREAIGQAEDKLAEAMTYPSAERLDEVRQSARVALDQAKAALSERDYDKARTQAALAGNLAQKAIDLARDDGMAEREVQIDRFEGDVRVKRAGGFEWETATRKMKLRAGDQIKTATNATAYLRYFDGATTSVEPGSLLEIRQVFEDPATRIRQVKEKLSWGEIMASTRTRSARGSYHEVATDSAVARSDNQATFRVSVDKDSKAAAFDALTGSIQVAALDRTETVAEGERLRTAGDGRIDGKDVLPPPPRLIAPSDERVFIYDDPAKSETPLSWGKVDGAARYLVMISATPLFSLPLYEREHVETSINVAADAGRYYWKVASVGAKGVRGAFSEDRRFRITSQRIRDKADTTPPVLEITDTVQSGSMLILNGRTEPGAVLWVGGEKVEVAGDGSFYAVVKLLKEGVNEVQITAQDAAGNPRSVHHRAYLDPM